MTSLKEQDRPYRVTRRLAVGGMGEVFLAQETAKEGVQRVVALKRILPHLTQERQFIDRFVDEARIMIGLNHPNLLEVFELRQDEWGLYMVMEYIEGFDLRAINRALKSRGEAWPPYLAVWVIQQACRGLSYAHTRHDRAGEALNLIHRDVSPSNILVGYDSVVKLIDFGVAQSTQDVHQSISGALQGKLAYMSPEQARGEDLSPLSDLFSLGLTLYEMASGVRPRGKGSDAELLRIAQENHDLDLGAEVQLDDDRLVALVNKALRSNPAERWSSMASFSDALEEWLDLWWAAQLTLEANHPIPFNDRDSYLEHTLTTWLQTLPVEGGASSSSFNELLDLQLMNQEMSEHLRADHTTTLTLKPSGEERVNKRDQSLSGVLIARAGDNFNRLLEEVSGGEWEDEAWRSPQEHIQSPINRDRSEIASGEEASSRLRSPLVRLGLSGLIIMSVLWVLNRSEQRILDLKLEGIEGENGQATSLIALDEAWRSSITVDGEPWYPPRLLTTRQPIEVCVERSGWIKRCEWVELITLPASAPEQIDVMPVSIQGARVSLTMRLERESSPHDRVAISARGRGIEEVQRGSIKTQVEEGSVRGPLDKAGSKSSQIAQIQVESQRRRGAPKSSSSRLKKSASSSKLPPSVEVTSPLSLALTCTTSEQEEISRDLSPNRALRILGESQCQAKATGYAPRAFKLPAQGQYEVNLVPQGTISVRVNPPAAQLWLDGTPISNPTSQKSITGVHHQLRALLRRGDQATEREWEFEIKPGEHLKHFYDLSP